MTVYTFQALNREDTTKRNFGDYCANLELMPPEVKNAPCTQQRWLQDELRNQFAIIWKCGVDAPLYKGEDTLRSALRVPCNGNK